MCGGVSKNLKASGKLEEARIQNTTKLVKLAFFPSTIPLPTLNSPEANTREQKEEAIGKALYFWLKE